MLEVRHGLDINNANHIWLLHYLFLGTINAQLTFFMESWNQHPIQMRHGPNRSPADLFGFDMFVHGVRGTPLGPDNRPAAEPVYGGDENLPLDELEVYGVDWEGLRDDVLLQSRDTNNPTTEPPTSWLGHTGPPANLSNVPVDAPESPFTEEELHGMTVALGPLGGGVSDGEVAQLWVEGLTLARYILPDHF